MSIRTIEQVDCDRLQADVCIIGTGPTGQSVARALLGSNADVLILEAGDADADRWGRRFASTAMPSVGRHYPNAGDQVSIRLGGTSDRWAIRLDPEAESGTGIRLHRLSATDFCSRPTAGADGWPIGMTDLEPYYRLAESRLGIPSPTAVGQVSSDQRAETRVFWAVHNREWLSPDPQLGRVVSRCAVVSLTADRAGRITGAVARRRNGDAVRVSADIFVLAMGTVQTTRLLLDSPWTEAQSIANSSGLVGRYLTDHPQLILGQLILEPGADTSQLQLLAPTVETSGVLRWPNLVSTPGPTDAADRAGIATTLLPLNRAPRRFNPKNHVPRPTRARTGAIAAASALADDIRAGVFDRSMVSNLLRVAGGIDEVVAAQLGARWPSPNLGVEYPHWPNLTEARDRMVAFDIFAIAEQMPRPENRIVLSAEPNILGGRRARIEWRWSADDRRRVQAPSEDIRQVLASLGVGRVMARRGRAAVHKLNSHHAAGTTRMSTDPSSGVVDSNLRTHDHPNLYIVGSAVFNTTGFANPTLTDIALGYRLGSHLVDHSERAITSLC